MPMRPQKKTSDKKALLGGLGLIQPKGWVRAIDLQAYRVAAARGHGYNSVKEQQAGAVPISEKSQGDFAMEFLLVVLIVVEIAHATPPPKEHPHAEPPMNGRDSRPTVPISTNAAEGQQPKPEQLIARWFTTPKTPV
jgi:hypothetical protein